MYRLTKIKPSPAAIKRLYKHAYPYFRNLYCLRDRFFRFLFKFLDTEVPKKLKSTKIFFNPQKKSYIDNLQKKHTHTHTPKNLILSV